MLYLLSPAGYDTVLTLLGLLFAFFATIVFTNTFADKLPKDAGREFAHDGKLSAGKPRGAGIVFVIVFLVSALIFTRLDAETLIYLVLLFVCMMTGFLDDAAKTAWGEYKKGFLDLCVAILAAVTFLHFNSNTIVLTLVPSTYETVVLTIPPILFGILVVILVWASVNVTNCSDGVDGLSGTLTLVTLGTILGIYRILDCGGKFPTLTLFFSVCILAYLWFNATPSRLMMGDAGSRTMGLFIALAILKIGDPLLYIPVAIVLILDGGLGLLKVALLRFLKIKILTKVRTPLHDQVRKVQGWSNTQAVYRFAIIQIVVSAVVLYLIQM